MSASTKTWLNNNPPSCEDDDLNGFSAENNNLIQGSGQALNTSDNQQTHKAVADYAASGAFYTDSGIADAYVLNPIGSHVSPPAYVDGMAVEFIAGNTNAGASTVNVAGLGVKNIVNTGFAGAITSGKRYILRYRTGSGDFAIISPFTESFISAEQTITAGGALTVAHGLGISPSLIQNRLICKTAELGYSIGDEVFINPNVNGYDTFTGGTSVVPDATNLNIRMGSTAAAYHITRKDTGATSPITPANWKLILRAWA